MGKFKDMFEAKQVGIIYHFTTVDAIKSLLNREYFEKYGCDIFTFVLRNNHISTTRGYDLTNNPLADIHSGNRPIRIAFDGNKISNHFKIKPINGLSTDDTEIFGTNLNHLRVPHKSEKEEVICQNKNKLFELKNFILEIQINGYVYKKSEELREFLETRFREENLNIAINIVRKWKPYFRNDKELAEAVANEGMDDKPMIYQILK